ncbi:DUF881 domain-containing protein [Metaclostridioides mangenotii]|jgi:uncharacterized protein YlxW (UPF0749 family)|uniref:Uncharacterized protein YlxW (UPF0749 family) n=1 Tax=Metaclostridioides mangenotii TaxID=1540 RepID=A0ABS4EA29_9FIRM|nr:DUF881 domain-containing protein [Clostridioides mangenotii]MBP1854801.1 uncharacterized protein YlxW (UPF0749 family) [Clostridioides mangenotii]
MKNKFVVLGTFILGIMISIFIKSFDPDKIYMTLDQVGKIESEIDAKKEKINLLDKKLGRYEEDLKKYEDRTRSKEIKDVMEDELSSLKDRSGRTDIEGAGIMITMNDSDRDVESGEDPNDLIIHDIDVLRLINDLRKSGSTAISINGERVLGKTQIKCSGSTITVNDTTYGQPFVIRALGDVDDLNAAVLSPDSYAYSLKEIYSINIEVESMNNMKIKRIS